jgi:hypothetical protein
MGDDRGYIVIILDNKPRIGEHTVKNVLLDVLEDVLLIHEKGICVPPLYEEQGTQIRIRSGGNCSP